MCRYVGDYFACLQDECVEHGMQCFAEVVRFLLGDTSVSDKKLGFGNPLSILGLVVEVGPEGMTCFPSGDKILKWLNVISQALSTGIVNSGAASKLAGGLSWGSGNMFHRSFLVVYSMGLRVPWQVSHIV